mgnify:CR=1 FL=1
MSSMTGDVIIAVDGPAAAGKTTASTKIAARMNIAYLESGRAYRLLAHRAIEDSVSLDDAKALLRLCDDAFVSQYDSLVGGNGSNLGFLRDARVGRVVSLVAKIPEIRTRVTGATRAWARRTGSCIVEGRDIGTAVFPDATIKFYLDATPEVRALRRQKDEPESSYEAVLRDVVNRDYQDSSRRESPLRPASDAQIIDTSKLSIPEVLAAMLSSCVASGLKVDQ